MNKKAFTLAEIMIVLTVIGVITGILLPIASRSIPDENAFKFKKADSVLAQAINDLVTSGKYYEEGNLENKPNKEVVTDKTYFCKSLSDILDTKESYCNEMGGDLGSSQMVTLDLNCNYTIANSSERYMKEIEQVCIYFSKTAIDKQNYIKTIDGMVFYEVSNATWADLDNFMGSNNCINYTKSNADRGIAYYEEMIPGLHMTKEEYIDFFCNSKLCYGEPRVSKIFCMDIDGIPENGSEKCDDINDMCPFIYYIRRDGKIYPGPRALEWSEKDIQNKD